MTVSELGSATGPDWETSAESLLKLELGDRESLDLTGLLELSGVHQSLIYTCTSEGVAVNVV
jgi:hypothetical protein